MENFVKCVTMRLAADENQCASVGLVCEVMVWHIWNENEYYFVNENIDLVRIVWQNGKHMNRRSAMTFTVGHPF